MFLLYYYYKIKHAKISSSSLNWRKYSVLIDCGSSGSRVYVYYWDTEDEKDGLPNVVRLRDGNNKTISYKAREPLSSFIDEKDKAVEHIVNLIRTSYVHIPAHFHSTTIVYVLATGGMRLVAPNKADTLISELRNRLPSYIKYSVGEIKIISGPMEGVFMWIGLNYILKNFKNNCGKTDGIFEMGGASMQIAFEVIDNMQSTASFSYQCPINKKMITHHIFSVTFLGLGANSAFKHYIKRNGFHAIENVPDSDRAHDPCLPKHCLLDDSSKLGTGSVNECLLLVNRTFDKYLLREKDADIFNLFKNNYDKATKRNNFTFYGLSEFWFAFNDFLNYNGPLLPSIYWPINSEFCLKECKVLEQNMMKGFYKSVELKHLKMQCFKVPFVRYILDKFLPRDLNFPVISIHSFNGEVLEWTYGAIVYFLSQK